MKTARLTTLQKQAAHRKPGYLEACLKLGAPSPDGQSITFTAEAHAQLRRDFSLPAGDLVHSHVAPIAKKIHWPCLEKGTTNLKPNSPCDKTRRWLNGFSK